MSLIIAPNGFRKKFQETLSKEEIDLVTKFTAWCERRNLRFDLLCMECLDAGLHPRCVGDNDRDATSFKINCNHAERIYGATH